MVRREGGGAGGGRGTEDGEGRQGEGQGEGVGEAIWGGVHWGGGEREVEKEEKVGVEKEANGEVVEEEEEEEDEGRREGRGEEKEGGEEVKRGVWEEEEEARLRTPREEEVFKRSLPLETIRGGGGCAVGRLKGRLGAEGTGEEDRRIGGGEKIRTTSPTSFLQSARCLAHL